MRASPYTEKLFTYGTLMESEVQERVIGRRATALDDTLEDYTKGDVEIDNRIYLIAIPMPGSHITGKVLAILTEELKLMDEYETSAYVRVKVVLKSGASAWIYREP